MNKNLNTAVLVLGHGSRQEDANSELIKITEMLKGICDYHIIETAFLQIRKPFLREGILSCIKEGAKKIIVVPYFLFMGNHVQKDLPGELNSIRSEYPDVDIILTKHIGADPKMAKMICDRILDSEAVSS